MGRRLSAMCYLTVSTCCLEMGAEAERLAREREERQEPTRQSGVRERIATNEALAAGLGSLCGTLAILLLVRAHTHLNYLHSSSFSSPCSSKLDRERERRKGRMCVQ